MVVICPKCKVRLKVADEKIVAEGTRFKCPKCSTVLLMKRPMTHMRSLDEYKILIAHEEPSIMERLRAVLTANGYHVITATDGIQAMVNATKELPFLSILSVSIPKIYGFEVSRRLKNRIETKDMKIILMASVYDQRRYRREPENLHGADAYLEEHQIEELLIDKINSLKGVEGKEPAAAPKEVEKVAPPEKVLTETSAPPSPETAQAIERAKRLARTIVSDIYLYSKAKVDDAIRNNIFHRVFASELREGLKLYENRVLAEVREIGDFFNEAINNFIEKRKKEL